MPVQNTDLRSIPLFASLCEESRRILSVRAFVKTFNPGQILITEGTKAEQCYFVCSGVLRVFRISSEGRIQLLTRLSAGDPVNVVSLLLDERENQSTVEVLDESKLLILLADDFYTLLNDLPDLSNALLQTLAKRISLTNDLAADLSLLTVQERLARFLIRLAESPQPASGWTQDEIAAQIGTVRDVVGRLLRKFEADGLIHRRHQEITLLDRQRLMKITKKTST